MVKNPASNAGDAGSSPGQATKIPHAAEQLSPHATTTEPVRHNYRARTPQGRARMRQLRLDAAKIKIKKQNLKE